MSESQQQWPNDPEFRRFAAKMADAVMFARSAGTKLAPFSRERNSPGENCPLGCLVGDRFPIGPIDGLTDTQTVSFIKGFDGGVVLPDPYNRLGRAYRARFVK